MSRVDISPVNARARLIVRLIDVGASGKDDTLHIHVGVPVERTDVGLRAVMFPEEVHR